MRFQPIALTLLRIAAGAAYFTHGAQKIFGWFGGFGPNGHAEYLSRFGAAGAIEVIAGIMLILGLGTRVVAFIASGEMAVTYFWMHSAPADSIWWWRNHGELPFLYCFIWLLFAAYGAGPFSLDAAWRQRPGRSNGGGV